MTQVEVRKMFDAEYGNFLRTSYPKDKILWREEFSNFIDALCKDGLITQKQYSNINYPKWMK